MAIGAFPHKPWLYFLEEKNGEERGKKTYLICFLSVSIENQVRCLACEENQVFYLGQSKETSSQQKTPAKNPFLHFLSKLVSNSSWGQCAQSPISVPFCWLDPSKRHQFDTLHLPPVSATSEEPLEENTSPALWAYAV